MKRKVFFLALTTVFFSCNKKEIIIKDTPKNVDTIVAKDAVKTNQIEKTIDSEACIDVVIEILTTSPSYLLKQK